MSDTPKIRFGFLGAGSIIIYRHAIELSTNPYAELITVYDPITKRAENLAETYGMTIAKSEAEVLNDPTIDAIVVGTPNSEHARLTIAALKAGKHVLCEKPMATTLKDAAAMIHTAEKTGKKLMMGHNQCLMPPHLKAKKLLQQKVIGDIMTFHSSFCHGGPEMWSQDKGPTTWFFKKEKAYVGSMGDLGVHKTYLLPWLFGSDIKEVGAFIDTKLKKDEKDQPITVDDNAVCILRFENGITGQLTASWTYTAHGDNTTTLYGTKGQMILGGDDPNCQVRVLMNNGEGASYKVGVMGTNEHPVKSGIPDLFVDCILDDITPPFDGMKGYKALAAVVACMESQAEKRIITVKNELPV